MVKTAKCISCGKSFRTKTINHKLCSESCRRKYYREYSRKYNNSTLNHFSTSRIGDISEIEMCAYFLRKGYEVFRNISSSGPADIIIWKPENNIVHIVDIKSYVKASTPEKYLELLENKNDLNVKIIPYDYNKREPLRILSDHSD